MKTRLILIMLLSYTLISANTKIPDWVSSHPTNREFYSGIGMCKKSIENYTQIAQQRAIQDIAVQIKSKVKSESSLSTQANETGVQRNYSEEINVSTSLNLEGYNLVDSWDNESEYWVYYELSIEEYHRQLERIKNKAIQEGLKYLEIGEKAQRNGLFRSAAISYANGLQSLKAAKGQDLNTLINDKEEDLNIYLSNHFSQLFDDIQLKAETNSIDALPLLKEYETISIQVINPNCTVAQLELKAQFKNKTSKVSTLNSLDNNGLAHIKIQQLNNKPAKQEIQITIDSKFLKQLSTLIETDLINQVIKKLPKLRIAVNLTKTYSAFIVYDKNNSFKISDDFIAQHIYHSYFNHADSKSSADVLIHLKSNFQLGDLVNTGIYTHQKVNFTFDIDLYNAQNNTKLGSTSYSSQVLVGAQLSSQAKYEYALKRVRKKIMNKLKECSKVNIQ